MSSFNHFAAPRHIDSVRLRVRDLSQMADFYQAVIGLQRICQESQSVSLGIGGKTLLELQGDASLSRLDPRAAGLFHTAFLLPQREDLARWLGHAAANRIQLQGASDHIVSEAIYLADPEGNGIEIYADREPQAWLDSDGGIRMSTDPLDLRALLESAEGTAWNGFPESGLIGHVHLQVGNVDDAERFINGILGFDTMLDYPGARFFGSGGYHHHLAGNIWNSRNAGKRPEGMAGLDEVRIRMRDAGALDPVQHRARSEGIAIEERDGSLLLRDPWGTAFAISA